MPTVKVSTGNLLTSGAATITSLEDDPLYPASNLTFNSLQPEHRTTGDRMRFNASEFAYRSDTGSLDFTTSFLCEIMFWLEDVTGVEALIAKWGGAPNNSYMLRAVNDEIEFRISADGGNANIDIFATTTANLQVGTMYVLRISWVGATKNCRITLNGQQILNATGTNVASIFNSNADFMIGARGSSGAPLDLLDGIIRYAQVGPFASPVSLWRMNWTGTVITDDIGSNDLTTANATINEFRESPAGYIDIDFGSTFSPDTVILSRHNTLGQFSGGSIWLEIRQDNLNIRFSVPDRVVDLTATTGRAIVENFTAPASPSRYARLYFTNLTPDLTHSTIYYMFIGNQVTFDRGFSDKANDGYDIAPFRINSANPNTIGNLRTYVKSEQAYRILGTLKMQEGNFKSSNDDFNRVLQVSDEASQNIPQFWTVEHLNSDYEETNTFLVYWINAPDFAYNGVRTHKDAAANDELWDVAVELQELTLEVQ